jgi:hypothetical protein
MADTITVKQLANRAGVEARVLRRILRSQFSREAKGKLYEWQPDDPQIELILKAVESHKVGKEKPEAEKPKPEKPKTQKAKATQPKGERPEYGKPDPTTGGVPINLSRIGTTGAVKQSETGA